jgi:PPM family protein phosphatase
MNRIHVESAGITDIGNHRSENQDQFLIADLASSVRIRSGSLPQEAGSRLFGESTGHLFLVADGLGGHRGGDEASRFAVQYCINSILNNSHWMKRIEPAAEDFFVEDLRSMLQNAHLAIEKRSKSAPGFTGMGTTLTLAYVDWPRMYILHAGDTRCYLFREKELKLVTRDHTVANEMVRNGQLAPKELEGSKWSNVLINALGAGAENVTPDVYKLHLLAGDSILLCSDGLNKHVSDLQIQRALSDNNDPKQSCEQLVTLAKHGGGTDNITVVHANFTASISDGNRMQLFSSPAVEESILQDLEIPETEIDTGDLVPGPDGSLASQKDTEQESGAKDTVDFSENENQGFDTK